jgi:hypothetical protein
MKNFLRFLPLLAVALISPAWAGPEPATSGAVATTASSETTGPVPLDIFRFENGYVFQSDLNHGGSFGKQDEIQNEFEYAHRFELSGNYYLHLGVAYDRYDFGSTNAPVPDHLQSAAAVIGIDYMHGSDVGAFIQVRPGFYGENDFNESSFDCPITLGRIFVIKDEKFYIFAGAYAAFLRGGWPVLPLAGVIYIFNDDVRLMGVLPDPKLIYSPTKNLDLWLGGELVGGSFRTDRDSGIEPHKLDGTQVDFSDYRAGVGLTYSVYKSVSLDLGGGYSIERQFAFHRAGENYRTDPSPYLRVQLKADF